MRYHKIRQWVVDDKVIDLVKFSTKKNLANMMTKIIPVEKFSELHCGSLKLKWRMGSWEGAM